ncbi:VBCS repeat-containing protein [Salinisphaera shabanensis T35B1]|uniref:choice-of-anchor U domain-containing protein n=1 Tax=Salinisphaera shabanensis TaxID=180542 RepID=UPI003341F0B6
MIRVLPFLFIRTCERAIEIRRYAMARSRRARDNVGLNGRCVAAALIMPVFFAVSSMVHAAPGEPASEVFNVDNQNSRDQRFPKVASDPIGNFVVVWEDDDGDEEGLRIFARRYDSKGKAVDPEAIRINPDIPAVLDSSRVAMSAEGDIIVVWAREASQPDDFDIWARLLGGDNRRSRSEFKVNDFVEGYQQMPDVAMDADGDFVVVWNSYEESIDGGVLGRRGIYGQRFTSGGYRRGEEFRATKFIGSIELGLCGFALAPQIGMDALGNFLVGWDCTIQHGDPSRPVDIILQARHFDSEGESQGDVFRLNGPGFVDQQSTELAMHADGRFEVVWTRGSDEEDGDVFLQRFAAGGTSEVDRQQVNTVSGDNARPTIAADAIGNSVVAWHWFGRDNDSAVRDILTRRYDANGIAQDASGVRAGSATGPRERFASSVAMDADGDFILAWNERDSAGLIDVFAQRFVGPEAVDLAISLADSPDPLPSAQSLTYIARIDNNHDGVAPTGVDSIDPAIGSASGVQAVFSLGDELVFGGIDDGDVADCETRSDQNDVATTSLVCRLREPLAAGASVSLAIAANRTASAAQQTSNLVTTSSTTVSANQFDPGADDEDSNNRDQESTTLEPTESATGDDGSPDEPGGEDGGSDGNESGGNGGNGGNGEPGDGPSPDEPGTQPDSHDRDITPEPFVFEPKSDVVEDTLITSAPVNISGTNASSPVSVRGGAYAIDCQPPYTQSPGVISNGQSVCVRHRAANGPGQSVNTLLTVGGVSGEFRSTTRAVSIKTLNDPEGNAVTLASSAGNIEAMSISSKPPEGIDGPEGIDFPNGFFSFNIVGLNPGESVRVSLILPEGSTPDTFYKFQNGGSFEFLENAQGTEGALIAGNTITLTLIDGGLGDADGEANGTIEDPGAPGVSASNEVSSRVGSGGGCVLVEGRTRIDPLLPVLALLAGLLVIRRRMRAGTLVR